MKTSVYGWGIKDSDIPCVKDGVIWHPYRTWREMIGRCYSQRVHRITPTYIGCSVCEDWRLFSNFLSWYEDNYRDGYVLDKDILVKGNKVYSPNTCCFVPSEINKIFTKSNKIRGSLPIGVSLTRNRYQAMVLKYNKLSYIGTYDTPEGAFQAYKAAKEAYIKEVANEYYSDGRITKRVYDALMRYKVEITD